MGDSSSSGLNTKFLGPAMAFNIQCQSNPWHLVFNGGNSGDFSRLVLWNGLAMVPCRRFHLFSNSENCEQPCNLSINSLFAKIVVGVSSLKLQTVNDETPCPSIYSVLFLFWSPSLIFFPFKASFGVLLILISPCSLLPRSPLLVGVGKRQCDKPCCHTFYIEK